MFKNYFKTAWRNLIRDKQFSILNLLGLSTGLACAMFIYLWGADELKVDKFFKNDARLFSVMENRIKADGIWTSPTSAGPTAEAMKADFPEVQYAVTERPQDPNANTLSVGEKDIKAPGKFTGKDFFHVFSYDLLQGNPDEVLTNKQSIVISENLALRLFGTTQNILGKTIIFRHKDPYYVSGVFKNPPLNATDQFDFLLSLDVVFASQDWIKEWGNTGCRSYVLLKEGVDINKFNQKLAGYIKLKTNNEIKHRTPFVTSYSNNYLYGTYENGKISGGRISYVRMFAIIAIIILVIASINFMNLSTAKAAGRMKEIGVRKVAGARRVSLILQYLCESILLTLIAFILSLLFVILFLPSFNAITGKQLVLTWDMKTILPFLLIALLTGLLAGSYPALYLSGFKPVVVLKGKLIHAAGEIWVRKGLVVFQFAISAFLIVSVIVVYKQIQFIQTKNLGYNKDNVLTFSREGNLDSLTRMEAFINRVQTVPGVTSASYIGHNMAGHNGGTYGVQWPGRDPNDHTEFEEFSVGYNVLPTMGFEMKEGRMFSKDFPSDSNAIVFNEAGIKFMGMKDPVGKTVKLWGENKTIIGVVKDFHFESMHENVRPLFFNLNLGNTYLVAVRIKAGNESTAIAGLEKLYKDANPGFPFSYKFIDENYQRMYAAETRTGVLSRYFAGLAIVISCLGLFGLAAFTAQKRQKEIGIRKVVGASVNSVIALLSKDFLKLVLIALLIAFPLSWWAMNMWLKGFVYRIHTDASVFLIATALLFIITLITIGFQSVKAATANPVKSLRTE